MILVLQHPIGHDDPNRRHLLMHYTLTDFRPACCRNRPPRNQKKKKLQHQWMHQ